MQFRNPFDANSFARNMQVDVNAICQPLFKKLGLNYFHYMKVYKDGSAFMLYSKEDWNDHWYNLGFRPSITLPNKQIQIGKYALGLWRGVVAEHIVHEARNVCNLDHLFAINLPHPDSFESYAFATWQGNDGIVNTYFNNIEVLLNFIHNFKEQAANLIKKYDRNRIIFSKNSQPEQLKLLDNLDSALTLVGNVGPIKMTLRELEIFKLLCRGLTVKEISQILYRSPRTIESHTNNLKMKLYCNKRSQLIDIAIRNNINIFY